MRQPQKRLKGRTQMKVKSSKSILMKLICCTALVVMSSVFALSQATNVSITDASLSSPNTTYTYSLTSGPPLQVGKSIVITGMTDAGNNGTFTITALPSATSFRVVNAAGVTAGGQPGTGTVFNITSGALLQIDGTAGSTAVHIKLYDSQIHSGAGVQAVPTCSPADQIPTDAYVLQGGSATGCDPGDAFEVTDNNPSTSKQAFGQKNLSSFHIETHYLSEPTVSITGATSPGDGTTTYAYNGSLTLGADVVAGETIVVSGFTTDTANNGTFVINSVVPGTSFTVTNVGVNSGQAATGTVTNAVCNTSGTICARPDSGFLTVTNNTGSAFSGTISLKGNSPIAGDPFCPVGGAASDTWSSGLTASGTGRSVTLALGSQAPSTTVSISAASRSGSNTTYSYTLSTGSDLQAGENIVVAGMADVGNNGTFTIAAVVAGVSFTVPNPNGFTATETGTGTVIKNADSSNCGGFNQAQTLSLSPNLTKSAFFGKDDYQITTLNSLSGDTLDVLPVPVPAGPLGSVTFNAFASGQFGFGTTLTATSPLRFSAGNNFAPITYACVPYADFSADGNPVCVELQITPNNNDPYFYTVLNDFDIDGFSLPGGIGGPAFLGKHAVACPNSSFDVNIFFQYTAATITSGDPLKGGGSGGGSCWVVAFDPSVAPYTDTVNPLSSFSGFSGLLSPPALNPVNRAQAVPLNFTFPTAGLHLCSTVNNSGSSCTGGASTPWVAFGTFPIDCMSRLVIPGSPETSIAAGGSSLQTISSTSSLTSYRFNWKISTKTAPAPLNGCVVVVTQFSSGLVVFPDDFKYVK